MKAIPGLTVLIVYSLALVACQGAQVPAANTLISPTATVAYRLVQRIPYPANVQPPEDGNALFQVYNFTRLDWDIEMGDYQLHVPGFSTDEVVSIRTMTIIPGDYTWRASSPQEVGFYLPDEETNTEHSFSIRAGETYSLRILSLTPGAHNILFVAEPVIFTSE